MERMERRTLVLVLDNSVHRLEQRAEEGVVRLVGEQEGRRRHGREELHELRARHRAEALQVGRDVVDHRDQGRVYRRQLPLAPGNQVVNGLRKTVSNLNP